MTSGGSTPMLRHNRRFEAFFLPPFGDDTLRLRRCIGGAIANIMPHLHALQIEVQQPQCPLVRGAFESDKAQWAPDGYFLADVGTSVKYVGSTQPRVKRRGLISFSGTLSLRVRGIDVMASGCETVLVYTVPAAVVTVMPLQIRAAASVRCSCKY